VVTRLLADVVRVAGAASFVAVTTRGGVAMALMALVLLGLTLLRLAGVPPRLDLATGALLVAAAWWALLGSYERYPWLDAVVHLVATLLVAAAGHRALVTAGVAPAVDDPLLPRPRLGAMVLTLSLGVAAATLWEMGEWVGHTWLDPAVRTGYDDTVGDLACGALGALVAGLAHLRPPRRSRRTLEVPASRPAPMSEARHG